MLVADLTQALEVTLRRQIPAGRTGHRLDHDGGHVARIVQRQDAVFQFQQRVFFPHRLLVVDVRVVHRVVDEAHVVHPRQQLRAIHLAVGRQAAHAHAAKVHTVIAFFSANEDVAMALSPRAVVGQCHLQCGVSRFRTRAAKQHLVQIAGRQIGDHGRCLKSLVVADLKRGGVVQGVQLFFDRFVDWLAVVARRHTPQTGNTVQDLLPVMRGEVQALGRDHHTRILAKLTVACEGQPLVVHVDGVLCHVSLGVWFVDSRNCL